MRIKISVILFMLFFTSNLIAQKNQTYYLDFFGMKYALKSDSITFDVQSNTLVSPKNPTVKYKFCGRKFLTEEKQNSVNPDNPYAWTIRTKYVFKDCLSVKLLDSIKISSLNKDSFFSIYKGQGKFSIYSFKIYSDNFESEIQFINNYLEMDREKFISDYYKREASNSLLWYISECSKCRKFLITDIFYIDVNTKKKYKIDFSFLIIP